MGKPSQTSGGRRWAASSLFPSMGASISAGVAVGRGSDLRTHICPLLLAPRPSAPRKTCRAHALCSAQGDGTGVGGPWGRASSLVAVMPPLGSPLPQNPRFTFQTITEDSAPGPASTQCPVLPGSPWAAGGSDVAGRRTPHVPSSQCAQRMEGPRLHGGGRARMGPVALMAVSSDAHRPSRWNPHPSASPPPLWVGLQHLSSPTPPAEPSPPASGGRWQPGLGRLSDGVSDTCFGTLQCSSQTLWKIQRRLLTITP